MLLLSFCCTYYSAALANPLHLKYKKTLQFSRRKRKKRTKFQGHHMLMIIQIVAFSTIALYLFLSVNNTFLRSQLHIHRPWFVHSHQPLGLTMPKLRWFRWSPNFQTIQVNFLMIASLKTNIPKLKKKKHDLVTEMPFFFGRSHLFLRAMVIGETDMILAIYKSK